MTTRPLKAVIHSRKPLHEGFLRIYAYQFDVEKHDGGIKRTAWEMMERGNAVAVLGHDPGRDEVVLGNEFRPGILVAGDYPYRDNSSQAPSKKMRPRCRRLLERCRKRQVSF